MPTNVSLVVGVNDGRSDDSIGPVLAWTSADTYTFDLICTVGGNYTIDVEMSNLVSSKNLTTSHVCMESVYNVSVDFIKTKVIYFMIYDTKVGDK